MNTSEVLDLSKENIQPLKHGRNAAKLGTALQAQSNAELHQKLLAEREQFELLIRMYEGEDPLKPHYDYVHWIEQSFPKHGPESNLKTMLENTLTKFKDDVRYKQDPRYAELLIKYIDTQSNPLEFYQLVYNQGLCTMCAIFYISWADEFDKLNDLKKADQIYELGMRVKAEPLDQLKEAHLRFQLSVGRRMLGHQEEPAEEESDITRHALHKIKKQSVKGIRDPTGAPGRVKLQILGSHNTQNNAPFKVYQGDESEFNVYSDGNAFPKQSVVTKENTLKPGPWNQNGGKHRSRGHATTPLTFQVHQDEGADLGDGHHVASVPRALKPRKIDNFTCPLAVFEPPDPSKQPMYCKNKVYAGGREFQFEELRAALYNRRYDQLAAMKKREEEDQLRLEVTSEDTAHEEEPVKENEVCSNERDRSQIPVVHDTPYEQTPHSPARTSEEEEKKPTSNSETFHIGQKPPSMLETENINKLAYEVKSGSSEANNSLFHCQSFTVNTKEAMNVVQEMWNSPSPAKSFGKNARVTRDVPSSPVQLDSSGVFKVPPPPVRGKAENPTEPMIPTSKGTQGFPIYSDDDSSGSTFPIYSDDKPPAPSFPIYSDNDPPAPSFPIYSDDKPPAPSFPIYSDNDPPAPSFPIYSDDKPPAPSFPIYSDNDPPAPSFPIYSDDKPSAPNFPIYSDDELQAPPQPATQTFQIYSDNVETSEPVNTENNRVNDVKSKIALQPFPPIMQPRGGVLIQDNDPETLKMLAFQSDSDSEGELVIPKKFDPLPKQNVPTVSVTAPTPVLQPSRKSFGPGMLPHPIFQDEDKFEDMTCNTKAFDFVLPSSTPLVGHLKSTNGQAAKNCANGSYIVEDVKKCPTKQDLSMIFEASKERYSSSSGSSGCKTQGSVCTNGNTSIPPVQRELLEKLAQISSGNSVEELEKSIGYLNISGELDPFSTELISQLLSHIGYPKKHHLLGLHTFDTDAPALHVNSTVKLGNTKYSVIGELGKGSYARVLKASRDGQPVALKQQRPSWQWEWYIVQELQSRLPPNMMGGYLHMSNGYIYKNASILESEWAQFGSILSVVNKLKIAGKGRDLNLAFLFSIQMISIVEHLHKCNIIHGDIKPDNFVLCSIPSVESSELCLKLIDFGRSIDMTLFPEGTTFNTVVTTDGFQCNEMKEGRPWTYQTDLYGLAGSIYCVLFYDYMKVVKKDNKWQLASKVPRYMMPDVWQEIFTPLLNVESCENLPDLSPLREKLKERFNSSIISQSITNLSNVLLNK